MCIHAKVHSYNEIMQQQKKNLLLLIGFFHQNANGIIFWHSVIICTLNATVWTSEHWLQSKVGNFENNDWKKKKKKSVF